MIPRAASDPEHVKARDYDSTSFSDTLQEGSWGVLQNRGSSKNPQALPPEETALSETSRSACSALFLLGLGPELHRKDKAS